jgi:hypothetical protein
MEEREREREREKKKNVVLIEKSKRHFFKQVLLHRLLISFILAIKKVGIIEIKIHVPQV